jgi:hypothetical protein
MTIPYVGRCLGSDKAPREGSEQTEGDRTSGVCVTCSGRFEIEGGLVVAPETAPEDERKGRDT